MKKISFLIIIMASCVFIFAGCSLSQTKDTKTEDNGSIKIEKTTPSNKAIDTEKKKRDNTVTLPVERPVISNK